jgi:hypothetical protein
MGEAEKFYVGQKVKHVSSPGKGIGTVTAVKASKYAGLMVEVEWASCRAWYYEVELQVLEVVL